MKTISKYEPEDIDLKGNKTHGLILASLLIGGIVMSAPVRDGDEASGDRVTRLAKDAVASVLSMLEESGYEIVKKESVPAVFRDAFTS